MTYKDIYKRQLFFNKRHIKVRLIKDMDDSKGELKRISNSGENLFKSLGFFSGSKNLSFIFKKTEKIVQGLYMATNHIKDSDTLKWLIRERAVDMLYISIQMSSFKNVKNDILEEDFINIAFEITSLLNIASKSFVISLNNASILMEEISLLIGQIKKNMDQRSSYSNSLFLTQDFFKVDGAYKDNDGIQNNKVNSSRKNEISNNDVFGIKKDAKNTVPLSIPKYKSNNRREQILELLGKQNNLTIKDFVKVITDCSEKTIQRELISLTKSGLIIKEGERRWSKYSLKNTG